MEVPSSSYARCVSKDTCPVDSVRSDGSLFNLHKQERREHPINGVDWRGAAAYCSFIGARLPTEAEWEAAARGDDGRRWPWGSKPGCGVREHSDNPRWSLQVADAEVCENVGTVISRETRGDGPFGTNAMAGNVAEWVADWYVADSYAVNPQGLATAAGQLRVVRGGSWLDSDPSLLRSSARAGIAPESRLPDVGFRCAWSADTL
jgi:iron(II)-dependent oxidoreductase